MAVKIEVQGNSLKITDMTTGAVLDWPEEITITRDPSGQPFAFLGTHAFSLMMTVGTVPPPVPPPPTPPPLPTPITTPIGGLGGPSSSPAGT